MSSAAMKWAKAQTIESGPHARALDVLAKLANENKGHSLFHSQATIAARMHCSLRTARSLLADLERLRIIQRARRSRGRGLGRTTDLIRLRMDKTFTFTRDQIKTLLQAAETASCKSLGSESYNRQVLHLQAAETAGDRITTDQPKKESIQEEQFLDVGNTREAATGPTLRVVNGGRA
ncbi:MAG: helix-turn-helix domain-containing protein [Devosia sp.]